MKVMINGQAHELNEIAHHDSISYERLCLEAGKDNAHNPTCVYSTPQGGSGTITAGQRAPHVLVTGNA